MAVGLKINSDTLKAYSSYVAKVDELNVKMNDPFINQKSTDDLEERIRSQARQTANHCPDYWLQRVNEIMFRLQKLGLKEQQFFHKPDKFSFISRIKVNRTFDFNPQAFEQELNQEPPVQRTPNLVHPVSTVSAANRPVSGCLDSTRRKLI